jgi:hypothetical protein
MQQVKFFLCCNACCEYIDSICTEQAMSNYCNVVRDALIAVLGATNPWGSTTTRRRASALLTGWASKALAGWACRAATLESQGNMA